MRNTSFVSIRNDTSYNSWNQPDHEKGQSGGRSTIAVCANMIHNLHRQTDGHYATVPNPAIVDLQRRITETACADLSDAAIKLMIAGAHLETLRTGEGDDIDEVVATVEQLVRSALRSVLDETNSDLSSLGGQFYLPVNERS